MNVGGGGGGFASGYLMAKNPEAAGAGVLLVIAGLGIYGACYAIDKPQREPIAIEIVEESLTHCANAASNPALYEVGLKSRLMSTWSGTLEDIANHENLIICMDDGLNDFTLPYDVITTNDAGEPTERHWGEYRVTGVVYQNSYDGSNVLVVKPHSTRIPETSTDLTPDTPHSISKIYNAFVENEGSAYDVKLPNTGTYISVILQQDGATVRTGSSKERNDDGLRWANEAAFEHIENYYTFESPT